MDFEENKLMIQEEFNSEDIRKLIYTVRGKQVMLDSDVARLYHYATKRINEVVKRNVQRFPEEFCFQLTSKEYELLKSHIATSNSRGGKQKIPYVFTEKGILMLSGLLKNEIAIEVSIRIVEAFVEMRKFLNANSAISCVPWAGGIINDILLLQKIQEQSKDNKEGKIMWSSISPYDVTHEGKKSKITLYSLISTSIINEDTNYNLDFNIMGNSFMKLEKLNIVVSDFMIYPGENNVRNVESFCITALGKMIMNYI